MEFVFHVDQSDSSCTIRYFPVGSLWNQQAMKHHIRLDWLQNLYVRSQAHGSVVLQQFHCGQHKRPQYWKNNHFADVLQYIQSRNFQNVRQNELEHIHWCNYSIFWPHLLIIYSPCSNVSVSPMLPFSELNAFSLKTLSQIKISLNFVLGILILDS